jgi:hypothetical protein
VSVSAHKPYLAAYFELGNITAMPAGFHKLQISTAEDWLNAISESNTILSAILAVIHPDLYDTGWKTTQHLRKTPEIGCQDVLS